MNETLIIAAIGLAACTCVILLLRVSVAGFAAYQRRFTNMARTRLEEAFLFIDPSRFSLLSTIGVVVVPPLLWFVTGNPVLAVLSFVAMIALPRVAFSVMNKRRRLKLVTQIPDALLMLSSSMRAGTSLQIALDVAIRETPVPLSQELGVVVREQRLGLALEDALDTLAARLKMEEIDLVVAAMTIARDIGGNLAETLDQLAATLRAKATMEGKIRALTSQGKLQGLIVGSLPLFLMFALSHMQPEAMRPLFNTLVGWLVLGVIAILEVIGFVLIRKIVTIDV